MWVGGQSDLFSEKRFAERIRWISVLFVIGYVIICFRLFYLQVLKGDDLEELSESNRTQTLFLRAPRGDFYDRKGRVLVSNRPSWAFMYSASQKDKDKISDIENKLAPFLRDFPDRWKKRLKKSSKTGQMVRLVEDVPDQISFAMREMGELVPGLHVVMEFRRDYPAGYLAGHLIGYLSEIDEEELEDEYWGSRRSGDLIGKVGLEKMMDHRLRGQDGGMLIEVDSVGRLKRLIKELPSQKGASVQLSLDLDIQKTAEDALAESTTGRGAVIVLEPDTGAVLAWVSGPKIDITGSIADDLVNPSKPFFNRAHRGTYPPGSPFKIITAIAGFKNNAIRINDEINCVGYVTLKDRRLVERTYKCWKTHGKVDFWKSLVESCDSYYYLLAEKIGADVIHETAISFGLGQLTQKDIPGERSGNVPSPQWKRRQGLGGWSTGDTYNMAIGQGFLTTTPIQMAVMTAGIATKGKVWQPYVIKKVVDPGKVESVETIPQMLHQINLNEETWNAIHRALLNVVRMGTGHASYIPYLDIYGKTGTAQNPHGNDHAWFVAFGGYPNEDKRIAVCVFVENGGNGSSVAAPIARRIFETAFPPKGDLSVS